MYKIKLEELKGTQKQSSTDVMRRTEKFLMSIILLMFSVFPVQAQGIPVDVADSIVSTIGVDLFDEEIDDVIFSPSCNFHHERCMSHHHNINRTIILTEKSHFFVYKSRISDKNVLLCNKE